MNARASAVLAIPLIAGLLTAPNASHVNREASITSVPFSRILHASLEPRNWLTYSGGYSSQRYSELAGITPENVKDLALQWTLPSLDRAAHEEVTPLVVDGVMYTVQRINDVIALNAANGRVIWTYAHKLAPKAHNCCAQMTRGLAIVDRKVFLATLDAHLIALDAATGHELWNRPVADPKEGYAFTHAPLVVKDKIIEGTAGGEYGIRGFIAAFNVDTGREVWRFHTIPEPGEPGHETWKGDSWKHGGAPVWLTGSYDPETNLTLWGVGNPGPDYNGDGRIGDNLYSCSVVALDADSGKLKWYYQFSPHNEFDWDSAQIPVFADLVWKGHPRKAMLWANRNGMFYVFDRITGEFLLGKPFVRVNWTSGFDETGRPMRGVPISNGTRIYPDELGATNWYSPSYSPRTGLFYVSARENTSSTVVKDAAPPEFHDGDFFAGRFPKRINERDAYSAIRAIDPSTGDRKWEYPLGGPSRGSGILTTASGILFAGSPEGVFYAFSAHDGKVLWRMTLNSPVAAGPMTYSVAGKQFVSIQARDSLYTFALGGTER